MDIEKLKNSGNTILEVKNLSVSFGKAEVVSDISFALGKGEVLALVGESGCGKSSASLALTGLLPPAAKISAAGINFNSSGGMVDLAGLSQKQLRKFRGCQIAYIFQEPSVSLNPVMTIREQIAEVLELHRRDVTDIDREITGLLESVGIPDAANRLKSFPHELSGGMQQRVMIAMALAGEPELLVADEPTTALDVTVQAQILDLLKKLQKERGMTILLISHNLGVVSALADRIAVMYAGRIVEYAPASELLNSPSHPYTELLLSAVPRLGRNCGRLQTIPGVVPSPAEYASGCRFAPRCPAKIAVCDGNTAPELAGCGKSDHLCACFNYGGDK